MKQICSIINQIGIPSHQPMWRSPYYVRALLE